MDIYEHVCYHARFTCCDFSNLIKQQYRRFQRRSKTAVPRVLCTLKEAIKAFKVQWVSQNYKSRNAHVLNPKTSIFCSLLNFRHAVRVIPGVQCGKSRDMRQRPGVPSPHNGNHTNKSADLSITKRCKGVIKLYTVINCAEPIFHSTFGSLNQLPPGRPSFERKLNEAITVVYYTECNHPMCARHQSPSCSATGNEEILDRPGQTVRHTMRDQQTWSGITSTT